VHAGGGGTLHTNEDLMRALQPDHEGYILACGPDKWVLWRVENELTRVEEVKFDANWLGGAPMSSDRRAALADLLRRRRFDVAHVRSLLGTGPEVIGTLKRGGCKVVLSFHDFTALCPNVQLLDASNRFCAGRCTPGDDECWAPPKWFSDVPRLKHHYVHQWRARMSAGLSDASAFVTTSPGAADFIVSHFSQLSGRVQVIEHGRDLVFSSVAAPPKPDAVNIVILGVQTAAKGRALVETLARRNAARGGLYRFHLLGDDPPDYASVPGVVAHGRYEREELQARLRPIAPSFSLIASIWPETYSHTLTESWAAGIPVLASDLGAPAERIRRHGGGWLLDPHDPEGWAACLDRVTQAPELWEEKAHELQRMRFRDTAQMAADYRSLYEQLAFGD
jgi:glycosyltransferase involved in cell wall biosynthesis